MARGLWTIDRVNRDSEIHGKSGLDGYDLPEPRISCDSRHAVNFIIDMVQKSPRPVTIIPTGPLSNIAVALLMEPELKRNIQEIILMGGAVYLGNRSPAAEFNIWADPAAARLVFDSGVPIVMVGLEATHKAQLRGEHIKLFRTFKHPLGKALGDLMEFALTRYQRTYRTEGLPIHDVCAVAVAIDREIATLQKTFATVEVSGEFCAGRTVCDLYNRYNREPNAEVALDLKGERVIEMIMEVLAQYG